MLLELGHGAALCRGQHQTAAAAETSAARLERVAIQSSKSPGLSKGSGLLGKRRIKLTIAWRKVEVLHKLAGLGSAVLAVHATVLPFNAERSLVADLI